MGWYQKQSGPRPWNLLPAILILNLGLSLNIFCLMLAKEALAGFMDNVLGVRPAGMAEAFTAVADDANAMLFNPAGLACLDWFELTGMYADLYSGLKPRLFNNTLDHLGYNFIALSVPTPIFPGNWGLAGTQMHSVFYQENTLALSYGQRIWPELNLDAGVNIKVLQWILGTNIYSQDVAYFPEKQKLGVTLDFGLLNRLGNDWKLGFSADNLVPVDMGLTVREPVPMIFRLGASYQWNPMIQYLDSLLWAVEGTSRRSVYNAKIGVETWWWQHSLALRLGVNLDQFSSGLSLQFPWPATFLTLRLDYAFTYAFQIENTWGSHRMGLTCRWDLKPATESLAHETTELNKPSQPVALQPATPTPTPMAEPVRAFTEMEYHEFLEFKQFLNLKQQQATQAAQIAEAAKDVAVVKAAEAKAAAEEARAANLPINLREEVVIGFERQLLSEYAYIRNATDWAEELEKYLESRSGLKLEFKAYNGFHDLELDFKNGEIDLFIGHDKEIQSFYHQGLAKPLVTYWTYGRDYQRYCLFVRDDGTITHLDQLKNQRLGYVSLNDIRYLKDMFFSQAADSSSMPSQELRQFPRAVEGVLALQLQAVDALVGLEYLQDVYQRMQLELHQGFKPLAISQIIAPNTPIGLRCHIKPAKEQKLKKLLLVLFNMHQDPEGKQLLEKFGLDRFAPFQQEKYQHYLKSQREE